MRSTRISPSTWATPLAPNFILVDSIRCHTFELSRITGTVSDIRSISYKESMAQELAAHLPNEKSEFRLSSFSSRWLYTSTANWCFTLRLLLLKDYELKAEKQHNFWTKIINIVNIRSIKFIERTKLHKNNLSSAVTLTNLWRIPLLLCIGLIHILEGMTKVLQ